MFLKKIKAIIVTTVLAIMLVANGSLHAQGLSLDKPLLYVGDYLRSGGTNLEVRDNYVYYTVVNGLEIIDVSDPTSPQAISSIYLNGGYTTDIDIDNNYAYVTEWDGLLHIIDISVVDSAMEYTIWSYETPEAAYGIDVVDGIAYVAYDYYNREKGLQILDVSNPADIKELSRIPTTHGAFKVQVQGDYAYIVGGYVSIVNISDPTNPVLVSEFFTGYYSSDLDVRGNLLYLADLDAVTPAYESAFTILNVEDKLNPSVITSYPFYDAVADVKLSGDFAIVANQDFVRIVDVSDSANLSVLGSYNVPGSALRVATKDSLVYLVDDGSEKRIKHSSPRPGDFQIINIADPTNSTLIGSLELPGPVTNIIASDSHVYALNNSGIGYGIRVFEIQNRSTQKWISSYSPTGAPNNAVIHGTSLIIAGSRGLEVVDISDPSNLKQVTLYRTAGAVFDVVIKGDYAIVTSGYSGIAVYNITNPIDVPVAALPTEDMAIELGLYGDYLYVADRWGHGRIYNVSDIENPLFVTTFGHTLYNGVAIANDHLYMKTSGGFQIYDLSVDPEDPQFLGSYSQAFGAYEIIALDNFVVVADGWMGVDIFDVSDPENLQPFFTYNTPGAAFGLFITNDYMFVADQNSLIILDNGISTDIEGPDSDILPETFVLHQNYPNPFNPTTTIEFNLPKRSNVSIDIYNLLGQEVKQLTNQEYVAGNYRIDWDGTNSDGVPVSTGMYFYRLETESLVVTKKMLLIK